MDVTEQREKSSACDRGLRTRDMDWVRTGWGDGGCAITRPQGQENHTTPPPPHQIPHPRRPFAPQPQGSGEAGVDGLTGTHSVAVGLVRSCAMPLAVACWSWYELDMGALQSRKANGGHCEADCVPATSLFCCCCFLAFFPFPLVGKRPSSSAARAVWVLARAGRNESEAGQSGGGETAVAVS
jgi:hypothetical protein